ncbi:MAG: phosphoadenosine phosphosulfate reductase family protein [Tannerellaceae bacterium]|jgi:3'-phosphoadenosine 5'-phosphosulfate sulfotransferase (PAPS reductase)/FAD synthetase|nr:phosphoadenosine phosphosulfate reductase family protein [Tannerellaceae bacterium]
MKVIVTFSGGKDSLAALLWVRNNLTKDFITVFCDTGWEHPLTYQYINEITHKLNLNLVTLRSKKYNGMIDMSMKKKRFPSMGKRYCTQELKIVPTTDYLLDVVKDDFIVIQGIRAAESPNRAKMAAQCNYFKYYLEPIETNTALLPKLLERLNSKMKASRRTELIERIGKIKNRLELGKEDPKFRSYRRKEILSFAKTHATDIWRPVFDWSAQQVIDYILDNGLEPNPLYRMGFKRVGCFPCIMSSLPEIYQILQRFPNRIAGIARYEQECKSSFLGPGKIPRKYYKGAYPLITDVARYVKEEYARGTLFDETEGTSSFSCMSYYAGVCE